MIMFTCSSLCSEAYILGRRSLGTPSFIKCSHIPSNWKDKNQAYSYSTVRVCQNMLRPLHWYAKDCAPMPVNTPHRSGVR